MPKTNRSPEKKMAIVLEGLKGEIPVVEICRKYGISQTMYYKWRDKFLEREKKSLMSNGESKTSEAEKARIEELERVIGKQAVEIQILKKSESSVKEKELIELLRLEGYSISFLCKVLQIAGSSCYRKKLFFRMNLICSMKPKQWWIISSNSITTSILIRH